MKQKYDLIVVGGGFAGFAAALAAARENIDVLIIDKSNCFGGAAMSALVAPFMKYWTTVDDEKKYLSKGIFLEITDRLKKMNGMPDDTFFNNEYLKILLNRMMIDSGADILFHSYLTDAKTADGNIKSITVTNKSGQQTYYADYFVDATGDGDLAAMCGCSYQLGREKDNLCQPMTLCFRVNGVDFNQLKAEISDIQNLYKQYKEEGKIKNFRENVLVFDTPMPGVLHLNSTRVVKLNPADAVDLTMAEIEAREQVFELFKFLKDNFETFKNSEIIMTAAEIGVRESRKIIGEHILTGEDLLNCTKFEDSIAVGNYDIDIHNPEGSGTSYHFFKPGEYYTIPYRCLTPKSLNNLLVAGRCISATHEAQSSIRIMPICCCIGQAAGTAAALSSKNKVNVKQIDVKKLIDKLKQDGALD